ncbi:hypothetical protein L2E82_40221 [Cichorium intybus]|uniref:Uncharacterized protein n=1 Tax=Cichorium intybus TaxID=13427 RepID=A0ACB9APT4_CICIN|nr:hypothetical protein L2E82_40221 [Cichorium intybus]
MRGNMHQAQMELMIVQRRQRRRMHQWRRARHRGFAAWVHLIESSGEEKEKMLELEREKEIREKENGRGSGTPVTLSGMVGRQDESASGGKGGWPTGEELAAGVGGGGSGCTAGEEALHDLMGNGGTLCDLHPYLLG